MLLLTSCFLLSFTVGYFVKDKIYLGTLDPLKILAFQEAAWVCTVFSLFIEGLLTEAQVLIFAITIILWWIWWAVFANIFGEKYKKATLVAWKRLAKLSKFEFKVVFWLYLISSGILLLTTIIYGGGGDDRLAVLKLIRPLEGFITLLAPLVFFKLVMENGRYKWVIISMLICMTIISGGKSAILILLLPLTLLQLIGHIQFGVVKILGVFLILMMGVSISILINYGATSPIEIFNIFFHRLMMEGDIYILALANNGIDFVQVKSLFYYIFSPIMKISGLNIELDKNIGSQIASGIVGFDVPTGPNGHWPVLLIAYDYNSLVSVVAISSLLFVAIFMLKMNFLSARYSQKLPIYFLAPVCGFLLQFPQTFFADPPLQFIYLVHVFLVSFVLLIVYELSYIGAFKVDKYV